ncbi:unnamed protein product [Miscanthus lutarioriparius]|uniref:Apple domain-containing protein n=1 Tax=Miscanthus lutarioriparius TaxID=422564 RepID=A0A811NSG0_9POAL|nr:unnamed protein product [Miscanthus lutarioriparius]
MHLAVALTLALSLLLVGGVVVRAQPFDYPTTKPSTAWANTDASLTHHVTYADGSVARTLNPAGYGFFCTNHQAPPCAEFLFGVAVVYYNSGGLATSVVAGIPQLPAVGAGTVQYMRLEHDGHLRLYEWNPAGWAPVFDVLRLFPDDCAFPTVCGAYGVCTDMQCSCPDAANFRAVDFRRPNRGCVPTASALAACGGPPARLVSLLGLSYFNDPATSLRTLERVSDAACRKACLDECLCAAAQFVYGADAGDGFCYLQSEVLSMETSRPEVVHYSSTMHLKVRATRRPSAGILV